MDFVVNCFFKFIWTQGAFILFLNIKSIMRLTNTEKRTRSRLLVTMYQSLIALTYQDFKYPLAFSLQSIVFVSCMPAGRNDFHLRCCLLFSISLPRDGEVAVGKRHPVTQARSASWMQWNFGVIAKCEMLRNETENVIRKDFFLPSDS